MAKGATYTEIEQCRGGLLDIDASPVLISSSFNVSIF
jgi:hypothetical protein